MTLEAILFTLACIGIAETAYLIETRKKGENPVCVVGENCEKVLGSKYSKVILFHNDVWGLLFYIAVAVGGKTPAFGHKNGDDSHCRL